MEEREARPARYVARPVGYIRPDRLRQPLYVVMVLFNPRQWQSRWKHYERTADHVIDSGATLITVDIAFGDREHGMEYAAHDGQDTWTAMHETRQHVYIKLRTTQQLWFKEAGVNVAVQHLARYAPDWGKVAWIDADWHFCRPNWVGTAIHALERYDVLQLFDQGEDLDPEYRRQSDHEAFVANYLRHGRKLPGQKLNNGYYVKWGWPGGAWACRREWWNAVGGLMDFAITGSGDLFQAMALIGEAERVIPPGVSTGFRNAILAWQRRTNLFKPRLGFITGLAQHYWHGKKGERGYGYRNDSIRLTKFDPTWDLVRDWQGLPQLVDSHDNRFAHNRDFLAEWQGARNEDSTDVDV